MNQKQYIEIETVQGLRTYATQHGSLDCMVCQDIDLRGETELLTSLSAEGSAFLGCEFEDRALRHIIDTGGLVFPKLPDLPYRPYRATLYTVDELMEGYEQGVADSFRARSLDATIHSHFTKFRKSDAPLPLLEALSQRLHDLSIDDALFELLQGRPHIVAIMGGHKMRRNEPAYRDVALIAQGLTKAGYYVATGGGPGAMEAGNLGAWMAAYAPEDLGRAIEILSPATDYHSIEYIDLGFEVTRAYPAGSESLAIPTWFYGHEPTNQFATHIAKYFANSIREDILLAIATAGVIYAPGSAGTIQEIFMDAAQNHYGSFKLVSPMVFFDRQFWEEQNPVYPLLRKLSRSKQYGDLLNISDSPEEIVAFIKSHGPVEYDKG